MLYVVIIISIQWPARTAMTATTIIAMIAPREPEALAGKRFAAMVSQKRKAPTPRAAIPVVLIPQDVMARTALCLHVVTVI
jgi:hypothetical protein